MSDQEAYALGGDGLLVGAWPPHRPCGNEDAHQSHSFMAVDPVINEERAFLCGGKSVPALPVRPVQVPAVGRIVHYRRADNEACWAAIITEVVAEDPAEHLWLTVFQPDGMPGYMIQAVPRDHNGWQGHTWHWPERVD